MYGLIIVFVATFTHCVEGTSSSKGTNVTTSKNKGTSSQDYSDCYDFKYVPRSFHDALEDCTAEGHVLAYLNSSRKLKDDPILWLLDEQYKQAKQSNKYLSKMWVAVVNTDGRWLYTMVEIVTSSTTASKLILQKVGTTYDASNFQLLATVMHTTASYACYTCSHHSPKCQRSAVYHEGHCYWLGSPDPVPYIESVADCQSQDGIPVLAKDKFVNGFLVALQSSYGIKDMWFGLHKIEPGTNWYYSNDELFLFGKPTHDQLDVFCLLVSFREDNQHQATCTYVASSAAYLWKCSKCEKKKLRAFCTDIENPCNGDNSYYHMGNCYSKVQYGLDKCKRANFEQVCPVGSRYFSEKETDSYRFQYLKARICSEKTLSCLDISDPIEKICGCVGNHIQGPPKSPFVFIICVV